MSFDNDSKFFSYCSTDYFSTGTTHRPWKQESISLDDFDWAKVGIVYSVITLFKVKVIWLFVCHVSSMGRALAFIEDGPGYKPRPDKTYYTVFWWLECPYKMNPFIDYSVYLCIWIKFTVNPLFKEQMWNISLSVIIYLSILLIDSKFVFLDVIFKDYSIFCIDINIIIIMCNCFPTKHCKICPHPLHANSWRLCHVRYLA